MTSSSFIACSQLIAILSLLAAKTSNVQAFRPSRLRTAIHSRLHHGSISMTKSDSSFDVEVDVAVIGGGIAGSTISYLLQEREKVKVALIDPKVNEVGAWYPNYGEWRDEWHALSDRLRLPKLKECTTNEWEVTDCFFGGSHDIPMDERLRLQRPYVRVDRIKMQTLLREGFASAGGLSIPSKLSSRRISDNLFDENLVHDRLGSTLKLEDGRVVRCRLLVDASGLESRLIGRESPMLARGGTKELEAGYQIAYGFIAHVDSLGPYDFSAMTLFDYRTDVFPSTPKKDTADFNGGNMDTDRDVLDRPTFMYTMPLGELGEGGYRVFFEETSLVGRGERRLSFEECKRRAMARLKYHGVNIIGVEEEEFCYIPMGGELPDLNQRIVGFGGAANMVHPSTGYHACRMLAASTDITSVIGNGLREGLPPDAISAAAYTSLWSQQNRGQRDFQAFGGDFLMLQPVDQLRGFFSAFFAMDQDVWAGFLAGWPGLPGNHHHETWYRRLAFALKLFTKMPNSVRLAMVLYAVRYTAEFGPNTLLRSLMPGFLFGRGPEDPKWVPQPESLGDEGAKSEARRMIKSFTPTAVSPLRKRDEEDLAAIPAPFN